MLHVFEFLVLLPFSAGLIGLWIMVWRRPRPPVSCCGACRYPVVGLESLTCPECGGDLRVAGILPPRHRLLHPAVFLLMWLAFFPVPATVGVFQLMRFGPIAVVRSHQVSIVSRSASLPVMR